MTERAYMAKLAKLFNSSDKCRFTIMPDTGGMTHRKGYDAFIICGGRHIAVEGKAGNGKLKDHQVKALADALEHGAGALVVRFISSGASFIKFDPGELEESFLDITWEEMKKPRTIEHILEWSAQ